MNLMSMLVADCQPSSATGHAFACHGSCTDAMGQRTLPLEQKLRDVLLQTQASDDVGGPFTTKDEKSTDVIHMSSAHMTC